MSDVAKTDDRRLFLATARAARGEHYLALAIGAVSLLAFIAIVPFARVPLAKMPAFIPSYEAALFFIDLITAVLLFDQFVRLRSIGILALASGYLFDAFIIVPHALSFPGAFSLTGLLGAQAQTTAWLYVFWHGGFSLFVIAYVLLRNREDEARRSRAVARAGWTIVAATLAVAALVLALTLLATWGHDILPIVMQGGDYSLLVSKGISPAVWALTLLAMGALWPRRRHVLDLWLMLAMWIWLFDIALSAVIGASRFDLGFYAGRVFGLIAASFLLITLVVEMARMHAGALGAAASAEQRLAEQRLSELTRVRRHVDSNEGGPARGEHAASFIHRQNIAHYRLLLESEPLDDDRRRLIEKLLLEEEAADKPGDVPH